MEGDVGDSVKNNKIDQSTRPIHNLLPRTRNLLSMVQCSMSLISLDVYISFIVHLLFQIKWPLLESHW